MKYRYLGSSGLLVSRITLGTMTFGVADWGCDEQESHAIIKQYLDAGGNFLDGADFPESMSWHHAKRVSTA